MGQAQAVRRGMGPWGHYGRPNRFMEGWKAFVLHQQNLVREGHIQEADTRFDFPEFLYGPIARQVYRGYSEVAPQYRRYARVESLPNFKPRRIVGLNELTNFGYVGEHGTYPEAVRTERKPAELAVDTYGVIYQITRHAIINDDSGELLSRNPRELGRIAGRFVAQAGIALIESNPNAPDGAAFFSSGRGNQGTAALSEDALLDAMTSMQNQTDDNGTRIYVAVRSLIVPNPRLEAVAKRVNQATTAASVVNYGAAIATDSSSTGIPAAGIGSAIMDKGTMNPVQGILPPDAIVNERWLSDQNNWFLFADPDEVPGFAVGFLNGVEEPFIGIAEPVMRNAIGGGGFDPYTIHYDLIKYKCRHDFGWAPVDPKGAWRALVP